jgi:hypothetical protein
MFRISTIMLGSLFVFSQSPQGAFADEGRVAAPVVIQSETQSQSGPLARTETTFIEVTAKITSIDKKTRRIGLVGQDTKPLSLTAGAEVKRFDELKVGDLVVARYLQRFAFEVREPTKEELANPREIAAVSEKNASDLPPGAGTAAALHAIVQITALDIGAGTVTLRLPNGEIFAMLAKHPENLKRVKVGDTVAVTYGESVALMVEPKAAS